ncbi:MAG: LptF/LptG family permease [Tepidisphaeraceae bacterium]
MSKTLFWYIFKDLLKVFLLTSGALAGIMSFGGLLRPLTQHGLDPAQMFEMLGYFMPAMTNYSWPVAALFATTFVYGRLANDNEMLAMRATGIGWFHILFPALVLAFIVFFASLAMALFVVPDSFRRAENVVYTNLARFVANEIQRNRKITFPAGTGKDLSISARDAQVLPLDPKKPREQAVDLNNVTIVTYTNALDPTAPKQPAEFFVALKARAFITMPDTDDGKVKLNVLVDYGGKFPALNPNSEKRTVQGMIQQQQSPPYELPSPRRETARFMSFDRLMAVRARPDLSTRVSKLLVDFHKTDQRRQYRASINAQLEKSRQIALTSTVDPRNPNDGATYFITLPPTPLLPPAPPRQPGKKAEREAREVSDVGEKTILLGGTADEPALTFRQVGGVGPFEAKAREIQIEYFPDTEAGEITMSISMIDAVIISAEGSVGARTSFSRPVTVPMPETIRKLNDTTAEEYLQPGRMLAASTAIQKLKGTVIQQRNHVEAELHVRFSFALACLVLVLVGSVVGTMFRTGNFVSAFALSTIPAIIALLLIMTGQHMAENVPEIIPNNFGNPLEAGLWTIWSGNILVATIGLGMFLKLRTT